MQEHYYEQLRSEQEETRAMFHDINKSLQAMRALVSEGNAGEANQVLAETQELFGGLGAVVVPSSIHTSPAADRFRGEPQL